MSTEPNQLRARIDSLLAELGETADIDEIARHLEEAHEVLVQALESVEKG